MVSLICKIIHVIPSCGIFPLGYFSRNFFAIPFICTVLASSASINLFTVAVPPMIHRNSISVYCSSDEGLLTFMAESIA